MGRSSRNVAVSSASYKTCAIGATALVSSSFNCFDISQNISQIVGHADNFFIGEAQIRQIGDVTNLLCRQLQADAFLRDI